jgi:MFS family permease
MPLALTCVALLGLCTGSVYVLGFTILHESVEDHLRGRVFSSLYTLVRVCLLVAFTVGPLLADRLGAVSESAFGDDGPMGVRLALWVAALMIVGAGLISAVSLRAAPARE